VFCLLAPSW